MILEVKSWQEECEIAALAFADRLFKDFNDSLASCIPRIPTKDVKFQTELLQIFIDALIGGTAMIGASYSVGGVSSQFEDAMVTNFRRKFFHMRKVVLGDTSGEVKVPIKPEEKE